MWKMTPSPINVWSSGVLGIEDYRKKSYMPIQYIETISHLFDGAKAMHI
jgi:hypothetical protein